MSMIHLWKSKLTLSVKAFYPFWPVSHWSWMLRQKLRFQQQSRQQRTCSSGSRTLTSSRTFRWRQTSRGWRQACWGEWRWRWWVVVLELSELVRKLCQSSCSTCSRSSECRSRTCGCNLWIVSVFSFYSFTMFQWSATQTFNAYQLSGDLNNHQTFSFNYFSRSESWLKFNVLFMISYNLLFNKLLTL